jgi:hypothetical protein
MIPVLKVIMVSMGLIQQLQLVPVLTNTMSMGGLGVSMQITPTPLQSMQRVAALKTGRRM